MLASATRVYRFGIFELNATSRQLFRNGRELRIQEQPRRLLEALVERHGELLTRDELREKLWPTETFVEFDDGLNTAIQKIRQVIGDEARNPRFVETVPRRGYRFIAPVQVDPGWYADLAVVGGYSSYNVHRSALEGTARGDTDGGDLNVLVGAGYDFKRGGFTFGPTASFNYTYVGVGSFTEDGSLAPLHFDSQGQESIRTALGIKASYDWKVGGLLIKPEVRAAWQHEYGDAAYELNSSFANGAGSTFTVNGPRIGRDSFLLGAGFAIQFNERLSTFFYYDGELGRTRYDSHNVTGGVRFAF